MCQTPGARVWFTPLAPVLDTSTATMVAPRFFQMCRDLGLHSVKLELPAATTQEELPARVEELNRDAARHGLIVQ